MARIFLLLAVVLVIFWWLRDRSAARRDAERPPPPPPRRQAGKGGDTPEAMVQCAQCGVHLPQGEAIAWRGLHYCRRSHLPDMPDQGDGARS